MNTEKFTDRSRKVIALANSEAQRFNHEYIGTEHILLGLVKEGTGVAANVLNNMSIDLRKVRLEVEKLIKSGPDMVTMGKLPHTPRTKRVLEYAEEEATKLNHNYVGTEHLLLGLIREENGVASQVLLNLGATLENVRKTILNLLGVGESSQSEPEESKEEPVYADQTVVAESYPVDTTDFLGDTCDVLIEQVKQLTLQLMNGVAESDDVREGLDLLDDIRAIKSRCVELNKKRPTDT